MQNKIQLDMLKEILDACAYFGPRGGSEVEAYPLPSSSLGSSAVCQHFPRMPGRNALSVGAPTPRVIEDLPAS
jgi:hypothetical protein